MGGAERITTELANLLSEDYHVTVVDFSGENYFYYDLNSSINLENSVPRTNFKRKVVRKLRNNLYKINKKDINPLIIYKEQVEALINICKNNKYDVLIVSQGELTALIPYIKARIPKLKIIAWQHSSYYIYVNNYYRKYLKYYLEGVQKADHIVCLTKNDQKFFEEKNSKSICIYNPLTLKDPIISDIQNQNIIFVGRTEIEVKGLDYLIELAKNINPDWKIQVAGEGYDTEVFKDLIKKNGLENTIIMHGKLQEKELKHFYSTGSIFISTSRWEGFGLVITEAMSSGLPIISFDNLGPSEILAHGQFGVLVEKNNLEVFSRELKCLMDSQEQRKEWQQKSLLRARDFNNENIIRVWKSILNSL